MTGAAKRHDVPVRGAWVRDRRCEAKNYGEVVEIRGGAESPIIDVHWYEHPHKSGRCAERLADLASGFMLGMLVQHEPNQIGRRSLGIGEVVSVRTLGGQELVLVDFWESGGRYWLPYQHLRFLCGVEQRLRQGRLGGAGGAERLRLRCLAHALELWNENTGALSHFDIDPLPHQIHLVHRILGSGHLNWMIADDVGLGKTIEVGMLLAALRQRDQCRRILLLTPPGLTVQWQEELAQKFRIDDCRVYGRDFEIHEPRHWKLYDRVIASVDLLKRQDRLESLLQAGRWDLVVIDEAHRLSRRQYGLRLEASQRYDLAAALRPHTDNMLLLTATPHQGMSDKFTALLELIRPDLRDELHLLELNPEILRDIIIRNRKDRVTDADGNLIFKGKQTHAIAVPVSDEAKAFDRELQRYLRLAALAGERADGRRRAVIGFVMTTYRKLAASSAAAIHEALRRRRERLLQRLGGEPDLDELAERDARFRGEQEELFVAGSVRELFAGELALLDEMIDKAARLLERDAKLRAFVEKMVALIHARDDSEKIVIFTEYRATQLYLKQALEQQLGPGSVELIHGGQALDERRAAIQRFEDQARFLISTEAGGEGINLHRRCHILVNYDLPWNPMRLVQRIGRLYRYGQRRPVTVFNMHAPESLDASIVDLLYQRLEQVVRDMAGVSSEFRAGLEDEILGQMAELLDVETILEKAGEAGVERTEEEIQEALRRARQAVELQQDLFRYVSGYDRDDARGELRMERAHLQAFVEGMFGQLGVQVLRTLHNGMAREIELPPALLAELPGWRARVRVTFDRAWGATRDDVHVLDLDSALVRRLLARAKSERFGGLCAPARGLSGDALVATVLRWQNAQGQRMRQEFAAMQLSADGRSVINSPEFSRWLLTPAADGSRAYDRQRAETLVALAKRVSDRRLADVASRDLYPESRQWLAAGWLG